VNKPIEIQLAKCEVARLDLAISASIESTSAHPVVQDALPGLLLTGATGQEFLGAGLRDIPSLTVMGAAGSYAFCGIDNCQCTLDGDAGDYFGHSMASGQLVCKGAVGHGAGAMARGGLLAVYGSSGDRAAASLRGADIIVRGNAGDFAGKGMLQGTLIIGGSAGDGLGKGMRGGVIFLRGDASGISSDIEEHRLREPDRLKIGLLLLKAGIKSSGGKEFRVFRSRWEST
jgi:methylamine---glutamate N-methyltransferase subunit B